MKIVSFIANGSATFGAIINAPVNDRVVDLGALLGARYADLKAVLTDPAGLAALEQALSKSQASIPLSSVTLLPVIPNPGAIWCIGLNYRDHVEETRNQVTEKPVLFLRTAASQVAHGQAIPRPLESSAIDYEGEIAVVIGTGGRRIHEGDAWTHVAGYACYNDVSVRDWQRHSPQWGPGKNFWRTGAYGPWLVTTDEIEPNASLTLVTRVNGQELQRATTDMMIHSIAQQIAYISTFSPLQPGDVLVTGTPGGVGAARKPQLWLKAGDLVEVEISGIGTLKNTVVEEADIR